MKLFFKNLKKYYKYAIRSAKAELKSEVADSRLNWLWWVIEPLAFMLIYTFVFGVIFNNKTPYFASFVMIGVAAWDFFNRMINVSSKLIINNRDLVTKVYLPKYILLFSKSLTYIFKLGISLCLAFILMIIQGVPFSWTYILIIPILFVLYVICFGIGMILMNYGVTLNDLGNLTNIGLKMMFYLSGVFFNINEKLGGTAAFVLLKVNPIAFCINELRNVTVFSTLPSIIGLLVWLAIGTILCWIGVHVIHKNENSYAKVI